MSTESGTSSRNINLSLAMEEKVLAHVLNRFKVMKNYRDQLDAKAVDWLKLYNAVPEEPEYPWQASVFVPYTYILITQIVPKLRKALFGGSNFIECEARTERFMNVENKLARWMEAKLHEEDFEEIARVAILAALKYPAAPMKVRWVEEVRTKIETGRVFGLLWKKTKKVTRKKAVIDNVEYWDFWWDPEGTSNKSCKDFIQRTVRNYEYILAQGKSGVFKNTEDLKPGSYPDDIAQIRQEIDLYQTSKDSGGQKGYNDVELLEYWGKYDINEDGYLEDIIVTVGNRQTFMSCQLNTHKDGEKQLEALRPLVEDGQYAGMPIIKMLEGLQNELNTIRNQRLDNRNFQLHKKWMIRRDSDIAKEDLDAGPGSFIHVDSMDDIKEIIIKDVSTTATIEESNVKTEMQQVSGAPDFLKLPDSATGVNFVNAESANRFDDMLDNLKLQFEKILNMYFSQYYMFARENEIFSIKDPVTGKRVFETVTPEEFAGEYYFRIKPSVAAETAAKQGLIVQILNILGKDPSINQKALKRAVLNAFKFNNVEEIMTPPDPTPMPGPGGAPEANQMVPAPMDPTMASVPGLGAGAVQTEIPQGGANE